MKLKKALLILTFGTSLFSLVGCGHGPGRRGGAVEFVPAVELKGTGDFFKGLIHATVRLSKAEAPHGRPGGAGGNERGSRGGGGAGGGHGGPGGGGPGGGGPGGPGGGVGGADDSEVVVHRAAESNGTPMVFRIQFTNTGGRPATFAVWEFNSGLGSFAVRPERFNLEPGASVDVQPMTTRLGLGGEGLQVALTLRVAGAEERQVIVLGLEAEQKRAEAAVGG